MTIIARIHNDMGTKFGVPRQSGIAESLLSTIIFEPPYRNVEALRGIEGFSHVWLLWQFSENEIGDWSPTVRPPRLGGNKRLGVFATRSPFRPNAIGLSSVRLTGVELSSPQGPLLHVAGADLMDGTPILDIKPYLPYTDCHPEATAGFTSNLPSERRLQVDIPEVVSRRFSPSQLKALTELLAADPRPRYHDDPLRTYVMVYAGQVIRFRILGNMAVVVP